MRLSFSLRENIQCEKICQGIQELLNKNMSSLDPNKALLVVDLISVSEETDCYVQKLPYHNLDHNQ